MSTSELELGVIEGFYGRPWAPESRLRMIDWLPRLGLDAYLYAPKADAYLRKAWREKWPTEQRRHLCEVAQRSAAADLRFVVGLSPYNLYRDYSRLSRRHLRDKTAALEDLGVAGLALLFDDMPGDTPDLAQRQLEICHDVSHWLGPLPMLVCPTYYSDDPVLDRVFGARPAGYLEELAATLPNGAAIFWTGPQVCSERIEAQDLEGVAALFPAAVALWDNYPVNDSRQRSPHLYLQPLHGRDTASGRMLASHWCNAMNQPALSLPALRSLAELYGRGGEQQSAVYHEAGVSRELIDACEPLARTPLDQLGRQQREALNRLARGSQLARVELRDWLAGAYEFDPACLTD